MKANLEKFILKRNKRQMTSDTPFEHNLLRTGKKVTDTNVDTPPPSFITGNTTPGIGPDWNTHVTDPTRDLTLIDARNVDTENESFSQSYFQRNQVSPGNLRPDKNITEDSFIIIDYRDSAKGLASSEENSGNHISIFDSLNKPKHQKTVRFPQISTAVQPNVEQHQDRPLNCTLPTIREKDKASPKSRAGGVVTVYKTDKPVQRKTTVNLFDFRQPAIQQRARKKQVRRLKESGLGVGCDLGTTSRYTVRPYEGACDDFSQFPVTKRKPRTNRPQPETETVSITNENTGKDKNFEAIKSPDEVTLAKIENAFREWNNKRNDENQELSEKERKRSSSFSPKRVVSPLPRSSKSGSSSPSSREHLNHQGNLRQKTNGPPGNSTGRKYRGIASPACSRRRKDPVETRRSPIHLTQDFIRTSSNPSSPLQARHSQHPLRTLPFKNSTQLVLGHHSGLLLRNKRLAEISIDANILSSSLPDLGIHKREELLDDMDRTSHRPRASSLNKPKTSAGGKSPALKTRASKIKTPGTPDRNKNRKDVNGKKKQDKETSQNSSPQVTRRVMLNTSLPTASPTFQRAMKGMQIPDKEYSKIFGRNRKNSIIQDYRLTESAFNSFRDDNELKLMESSGDALEEMTNRFREDIKDYKPGWSPKTEARVRKSILKKRRQSVDDLEIGTRKNLAKYLESKLTLGDEQKLPQKQPHFG